MFNAQATAATKDGTRTGLACPHTSYLVESRIICPHLYVALQDRTQSLGPRDCTHRIKGTQYLFPEGVI